jgi:CheY-like chemotaxis protein
MTHSSRITILVADDDAEDRLMIKEALKENHLADDLYFVNDGEDLMDFLLHKGEFQKRESFPRPGLILLDLNMPKKDGLEALAEIKKNPNLRTIPVVVLTTSTAQEGICRTYDLGGNSFITKPVTFDAFVSVARHLGRYWFEVVELPIFFGPLGNIGIGSTRKAVSP